MIKILFRGNKKSYFQHWKNRERLSSAYALFFGLGILFLLSLSFISAAAIFRVKTENLERERLAFFDRIAGENEKILSDWKNQSQGRENETD